MKSAPATGDAYSGSESPGICLATIVIEIVGYFRASNKPEVKPATPALRIVSHRESMGLRQAINSPSVSYPITTIFAIAVVLV